MSRCESTPSKLRKRALAACLPIFLVHSAHPGACGKLQALLQVFYRSLLLHAYCCRLRDLLHAALSEAERASVLPHVPLGALSLSLLLYLHQEAPCRYIQLYTSLATVKSTSVKEYNFCVGTPGHPWLGAWCGRWGCQSCGWAHDQRPAPRNERRHILLFRILQIIAGYTCPGEERRHAAIEAPVGSPSGNPMSATRPAANGQRRAHLRL